jgi:hypothetical protein
MTELLRGSCLCGAARYEVAGPLERFFLCHCSRCRKDTGSAHAANLFSSKATLTWLAGTDSVETYNVPGTRHRKSFCRHCGSALPRLENDGAWVVVPAGSLDDPLSLKPDAHIFVASRADWDDHLEAVPAVDGSPFGG